MKDVKAKAAEKKAASDKASQGEAAPEAPKAEAKAAPKKAKGNRMGEEELLGLYPHAKPGTLRFLGEENKQVVTIGCIEDGCDNTREVRTSDLFQVKRCRPCTLKNRRAASKAKRAAKKATEKSED
jgi:hypothetical protein